MCLVNPDTLVHDKVMNFFGNNTIEKVDPLTAVASTKEKKVLGIYGTSGEDFNIKFVFLRAGHGMVRKSISDILTGESSNEVILCLETSSDDNIVFGGGGIKPTSTHGNKGAKVYALSFDESIEVITGTPLIIPGNHSYVVSTMQRVPNTDVLCCGTEGTLFVVEWTGTHFEILTSI